ncbi:MAG: redoxin domain-containing protein [Erysipelotrichia bacterium]|nr:redoxin domain-containing protein [Erysipelotrichia bacterium]
MANNKHYNKNTIYTRNIDPIMKGTRFSNIVLYDNKEEEVDLHMIKALKLCVSIPTFTNRSFTNDLAKLDILMKDFEEVACFAISNEPVFTQNRLCKPLKLEKMQILSDFKNREYARASGTYIYELGQLVKSVFLIDRNDKVHYVKYYDDLYSNFDLNEIAKAIKEAQDNQ